MVTRGSTEWAWPDLPTAGVLWVDLVWGSEPWRTRLMGRDNFWLDERRRLFGMYPDPENVTPEFADEIITAWRYDEHGSYPIEPPDLAGINVLAGILLPDELWDEVSRVR